MTRAALAAALAAALLLPGCAMFEKGEGTELITLRNMDDRAVSVILRITHSESGLLIHSGETVVERGATHELHLLMRPGVHVLEITTTNGISEIIPLDVPETGDTHWYLDLHRGRAALVAQR